MVLVTTSGVTLTVGENNVPVPVMVRVTVGVRVAFLLGASDSAMKPTQ